MKATGDTVNLKINNLIINKVCHTMCTGVVRVIKRIKLYEFDLFFNSLKTLFKADKFVLYKKTKLLEFDL